MSVKVSVSLSEQQNDFARDLVASGKYSSVSAVVQRGLELLKSKIELEAAETEVLRAFFRSRREGEFITVEEGRKRTKAMLERKRREHRL